MVYHIKFDINASVNHSKLYQSCQYNQNDSVALTIFRHYLFVRLFSWRYNPLWLYFSQPGSGLWPPRFRGFLITHNDAPQSVGLLWTSVQSVAETSTGQHTTLTSNIHAPGGIRTHNLSRRATEDLRLRPHGHWDRHLQALNT